MKQHGQMQTYQSSKPESQIFLLTTPISTLKNMGIKNPVDIVAHWTISINGWCYELARQSIKKEPYTYRAISEGDWRAYRAAQGKPVEVHLIGNLATEYPHQLIDEVASLVWERTLKKKYAFDDKNCQVFIRLLIELIGNQHAKVEFPAALDKWVAGAGTTRDVGAIAIASSASLFVLAVGSVAVDPTGTTAAGFGLAASMALRGGSYGLLLRATHKKQIKDGQKEIRKEMRSRGRALEE